MKSKFTDSKLLDMHESSFEMVKITSVMFNRLLIIQNQFEIEIDFE